MAGMSRINHTIWGIDWPAILSNISIPLLDLVDAAILRHWLREEKFSAIKTVRNSPNSLALRDHQLADKPVV